jgi:hypothetical protein
VSDVGLFRYMKPPPRIAGVWGFGFLIGLLLGGVLGWVRLGDGTIDWGTAGEWLGGLATAAAVWWAMSTFVRELQQRVRIHATAVTVMHDLGPWYSETNRFPLNVVVSNYGSAPVHDVVAYGKIEKHVEWTRVRVVQPLQSGTDHRLVASLSFSDLSYEEYQAAKPEVWVEFRDVEQLWWRKDEDSPATRLRDPSPEAYSEHASSQEARVG